MNQSVAASSLRVVRRPRSAGFTLVELLVVISIIGMLVGLMIPAIKAARDAANKVACLNNMRQIGQALYNYDLTRNEYPGYLNVLIQNNGRPYVDPQTNQRRGVSFVVPLLASLDRPDLDRAWHASPQAGGAPNTFDPQVRLDILTCAANPPTNKIGAYLAFVANAGMADTQGSPTMPRDWADNGVFFDRYTGDPRLGNANNNGVQAGGNQQGGKPAGPSVQQVVMSSAIVSRGDGTTNTLLLSENVDSGMYTDTSEAKLGMIWNGTGTVNLNSSPPNLNPPDDAMRINRSTGMSDVQGGVVQNAPQANQRGSNSTSALTFARPSSYHPGGVNVIFCDGHGRFLSQDIDYYVYCLLMSTNGQKVRLPGSNKILPNFNEPLVDTWLY
jgi:prepilin-type N-terminal cleavage/methylation domain-containing protein/prepilin-type processing-associated H-X9-DG protein